MNGQRSGQLARLGVWLMVGGAFVFQIGIFPGLIRLELTPGLGILQITLMLAGITLATLGGYLFLYVACPHPEPPLLRQDVGVRLMATGLVVCYATGYADLLGIGSHYGVERPLFGAFQALGVAFGVLVVLIGAFVYSRR